jgi:hypothetical protein
MEVEFMFRDLVSSGSLYIRGEATIIYIQQLELQIPNILWRIWTYLEFSITIRE